MANYLVTGGAGFIGSNIVRFLLDRGDSVRVFDDFSTGKRENLKEVADKIDLVEGDLRDFMACRRATADMDYVLHQAAMASVPRSIDDPLNTSHINVLGTINMLEAARQAKVRRLVYAASSSAYGDQSTPAKGEDLLPRPLSPYAAAKLSGEYFCQAFSRSMDFEAVCVRYFNVFGPRQDPTSTYSAVIPLFVTAVIEGRQPTVFGDGRQTRDFTFVENNVRANILAAETDKPVAGRVFNIACGTSYSLLDLLGIINEVLGKDIEPIFEPARAGDVRHSLADITLAREMLDYEVLVDFNEGMRRTIEWYQAHAEAWS